MDRSFAKVTTGGRPVCWLGASFWSRTGGPLMWRSYDAATVRADLAVLRQHGLQMTRSFFYWPDFMPAPDRIDETMASRFASFLDLHAEAGMTTVPTFIVGHMSGENWDPPWRAPAHAARYYRQVLHNSLLAGAPPSTFRTALARLALTAARHTTGWAPCSAWSMSYEPASRTGSRTTSSR